MIFTSNMPLYLKYDYNFCYISATDTKYKGTLNQLLGMYLILLELYLVNIITFKVSIFVLIASQNKISCIIE